MAGELAGAHLTGAALLRGAAHADMVVRVSHDAPHGTSRQIFKNVLDDKARGVFQGKIYVAKDAQKTDGHQLSRALLLSDKAEMDAKPELEIYADDVKCSHGSAIGDLEEQEMFYLRSRGIRKKSAGDVDRRFCGRADRRRFVRRICRPLAARGELMAEIKKDITSDFPALQQKVHGHRLAYLDSGASAQKPRQVLAAMTRFYETDYANIHRGVHDLSMRATQRYDEARRAVQMFINAAHEDEIVFTRGATESINLVAASWGRTFLKEGDEIVLTRLEHHANIVPWQMLRQEKGIVLRVVPSSLTARFCLRCQSRYGPKTKLVSLPMFQTRRHDFAGRRNRRFCARRGSLFCSMVAKP